MVSKGQGGASIFHLGGEDLLQWSNDYISFSLDITTTKHFYIFPSTYIYIYINTNTIYTHIHIQNMNGCWEEVGQTACEWRSRSRSCLLMTNSCGKTTLLTGKRLHPGRGVSIIQTSNREDSTSAISNLKWKSSNIGQQSTDSSSSSKRSSPPTKCPSNCTEILPNWQCQCNDQLAIYSSRIGESFPKSAPKSSGAAFVDNETFF